MLKQVPGSFTCIVEVPIAGSDVPGLIEFKCRALKRKAFNALMDRARNGKLTEIELLDELVEGWNEKHQDSLVTVPYSTAAVDELLETYWGAGKALVSAYVEALSEARAKN